jgi:hypothetical protein
MWSPVSGTVPTDEIAPTYIRLLLAESRISTRPTLAFSTPPSRVRVNGRAEGNVVDYGR